MLITKLSCQTGIFPVTFRGQNTGGKWKMSKHLKEKMEDRGDKGADAYPA